MLVNINNSKTLGTAMLIPMQNEDFGVVGPVPIVLRMGLKTDGMRRLLIPYHQKTLLWQYSAWIPATLGIRKSGSATLSVLTFLT